MIDYISFFIVTFLTIVVILICYKKFINEKIDINIKLILVLILGSIISTIFLYFNQLYLKNIFTLIFFTLVFKSSSKRSFLEITYYAIIMWIYGFLLDTVIMIAISATGLSQLLTNVNVIYARVISSVALLVLIYFFCTNRIIQKFTNNTVNKLIKIKFSHLLEIGFVAALVVINVLCAININKISAMFIYCFLALLIITLVYQMLDKKYNIKKLKDLNKILIKNNEFFIKMDTDYRILKHNLTSQLLGIKSVADNKTKDLIDTLIESYNSNFVASQDIYKIPEGINGVIYEKFYSFNKPELKLAVENNLTINLLDSLKARTFNNMCETLGVLVDNALEAAYESNEKAILIDFSEQKDYIIINISNTFNNVIDLDSLGEKDYSTKGNSHGIGLFSLFRKKDVKLKTKIVNNLYQTELRIKKYI